MASFLYSSQNLKVGGGGALNLKYHRRKQLYFGVSCLVYCAVLERPLQELREELQLDLTEALASYRKHCCCASVSAGQVRFGNKNYCFSYCKEKSE